MMRQVVCSGLVLAVCAAVPGQDKKGVPRELEPFQGTWKVVKLQLRGQDNPKGGPTAQQYIFAGDKVTVKEGKEEFTGTVKVNPKKDPAELDFVLPKEENMLCIYKLDKDGKLTICFELTLGGKDKDTRRPKSFDTKDTTNVLIVLEKLKE